MHLRKLFISFNRICLLSGLGEVEHNLLKIYEIPQLNMKLFKVSITLVKKIKQFEITFKSHSPFILRFFLLKNKNDVEP